MQSRQQAQKEQVNDKVGPGAHGRAAELLWWVHSSADPEETWERWDKSGGRGESDSLCGMLAVPGSALMDSTSS